MCPAAAAASSSPRPTPPCCPNLANLTYLERLGSEAVSENRLPRVAGFDVRVVPDGDMLEGVYFILQHKDACPFVQKLAKYKIQKDPLGIDGNVIEGRVRYWAGVLAEKCDGVYVYCASDAKQAAPTFGGSGNAVTVTAEGATIYCTVGRERPALQRQPRARRLPAAPSASRAARC